MDTFLGTSGVSPNKSFFPDKSGFYFMIETLLKKINAAPTFMGLMEEKEYIDALMKMDCEYIASNIESFFSVLDRLDESHSNTGYFDVTSQNRSIVVNFSAWLADLPSAEKRFKDLEEDLQAYAHTFSLFPWEIYGSKNKQ